MRPAGIIFKNFLPFLKDFLIENMVPASTFDFSGTGKVELTAVTFQRGERHDYIIFLVPYGSGIKIPFPAIDNSIEKFKQNLHFFDYPVDRVMTKNGGVKTISTPGEAYIKNKIIITMKDRGGMAFYLLIPEYFLAAIFRFCGVIFDGTSDIEKPVIPIADELESIDPSILHSNSRLFVKYYTLMRQIENDAEISVFLTSVLESGFIDYNHLASLKCYYSDFHKVFDRLSKNTRAITDKLYDDIKDLIINNGKDSAAWKGMLDYQFHNVISRYVFSGDPGVPGIFTSDRISTIDSQIAAERAAFIERYFSFSRALEYFTEIDNATFLIGTEMRNLLVNLASLGCKADFDKLFNKFGPEFKNGFMDDLRKKKLTLENINIEKRKALTAQNMMRFRKRTGNYIFESVIRKRTPLGLNILFERAGSMGRENIIMLYNNSGYEKFASLFEAFRYSRYSPVSKEEADSLFDSTTAMLPYIERWICRDIYYEKINRDRLINENTHDMAVRDISHVIMFMDEMNFTGVKND